MHLREWNLLRDPVTCQGTDGIDHAYVTQKSLTLMPLCLFSVLSTFDIKSSSLKILTAVHNGTMNHL